MQSLSPTEIAFEPSTTVPPRCGQQKTRRGSPSRLLRHFLSMAAPYILCSKLSIFSSGSACTVAEVPGEEIQRGQRDALRLLHVERPAGPALAHGPFADRPLATEHVPSPGAGRAAVPAQRLHRLLHPPPRMELALVQVGLAPSTGHAQDRQRPERVQL